MKFELIGNDQLSTSLKSEITGHIATAKIDLENSDILITIGSEGSNSDYLPYTCVKVFENIPDALVFINNNIQSFADGFLKPSGQIYTRCRSLYNG